MNIVGMQTHKDDVGLYSRSFPHYNQLAEIFGKDRANEKGAKSTADAVEELDREERSNNINNVGDDDLENIDRRVRITNSNFSNHAI